jgi:DNA sulfur modification protein DndD
LSTSHDKNLILIGGKNGFGKTNFLLALVWCLYGDKIEFIDENFKKEIKKEKNFSQFIKQTLNWEAEKEGKSNFFVELYIDEIEIPKENSFDNVYTKCKIKREFDINTMRDNLEITFQETEENVFTTDDEKIDFINDYIVPLEAAKFVFFDAEKIASLAELTTKEEGEFMNDALGKLLGLDIYEGLVSDLEVYSKNLKKEGATENIREQIINTEDAIKLSENKIDDFEYKILEIEEEIQKAKIQLKEYDNFLNQHSKKALRNYNREELTKRKDVLLTSEKEYEKKFNELSEILPFAIASSSLEEVFEHINQQDKQKLSKETTNNLLEQFDEFIETLFNKSPNEESMTFKAKTFYYNKAQELYKSIFKVDSKNTELQFEHDLNNVDKELIKEAYNIILQQSKEIIQQTIEGYNRTKNEIQELETTIRQIDADLQDETILEFSTKREDTQTKIDKLNIQKGALENEITKLKKDISKFNQKLEVLSNKVETRDKLKKKLEATNNYIKVLNLFIEKQKKAKENNLGKNIFAELQTLMHKLQSENLFIEDVKVHALPENGGLKVTLYNSDGNPIPKETLSQGEKQLYISCLIKAMLNEAIQDFPIFIDTPLGRLDHEHINNVLLSYYPDLAKQVVILATNNEIPPSRFKQIEKNVSSAYLLVNKNNRTTIQNGYFQSYEN